MRVSFPSFVLMLVLLVVAPVTALSHPPEDGDAAHTHSDDPQVAESTGDFFTTRDGAKYLPPADDEDVFHFVVYGDRTGGVPEGLKVLEQAVKDTNLLDPDLVMTVGDLIQGYNETADWLPQAADYKEIMNRLSMKWYPVAGNHDVYWRGPTPPPPGHHEANYEKHFGPLWYSFRHKNSGFVVLYSDEGDPVTNEKAFNRGRLQTMSDEQLDFLQQALDDLVGAEHVFVFLHHPRWTGGGYQGGNWDKVHDKLVGAGNVSAVFAGHIHHMRFDGPTDGIEYYTLATTGGHLSAEIPGAGYLHHLNMVSVRKKGFSVASMPVGAVMDPKEFTPEFLAEIEKARSIRPKLVSGELQLSIDGSAKSQFAYRVTNPTGRPVSATVMMATEGRGMGEWRTDLDHAHFELPAGGSETINFALTRSGGATERLQLPVLQMDLEYLGEATAVKLPTAESMIPVKLAAVPADYFAGQPNHCLESGSDSGAVRVESESIDMPDGPMTVEAWVKPETLSQYGAILAKTQGSEFAIFFDEGAPQFDIHLNGKYVTAASDTSIADGQWTHIAGVFDGQSVRLYLNGKLSKSVKGSGKRKLNRLPLYVGADPGNRGEPTRPFRGLIDEVRVTAKATYDSDFEPARRLEPVAESRLMLHFDRRFGPFVLDHSSSAGNGVLGTSAKLVPVP